MLGAPTTTSFFKIVRRQLSFMAPTLQQAKPDPIKEAFVDKVREFSQKQKALGDQKLVDGNSEVNQAYQEELERVHRTYQVKSQDDFVKFPSVQFEEPKIDPLDLHEPKHEDNLKW